MHDCLQHLVVVSDLASEILIAYHRITIWAGASLDDMLVAF